MYATFRSLLFKLDAERAHQVGVGAARVAQTLTPGFLESQFAYSHPSLHSRVFGLDFTNPVGLAAGFDKNARLIPFWKALGFGFAEVGSVSARRSKGNPKPRAFRLPEDKALINRMGLNNDGAERIANRLRQRAATPSLRLGINIAKTHDPTIMGAAAVEDFRTSFSLLAPLADYVALNISCPNTAEGKTFEAADALEALLEAIAEERDAQHLKLPILLKLSPPETEKVVYDSVVEDAVRLGEAYQVAGYIATNTASDRAGLSTSEERLKAIGRGGLSGVPLQARSNQLIRYLYRLTGGKRPIIGVGGVSSGETAYAKIRAGASLIQLYTGLVYEGPGVIRAIKEDLVERLQADGYSTIHKAVGQDA